MMNLERLLRRHPGLDLRRIDLMLGEKQLRGCGLGTEAIRLLVAYAFNQQDVDAVFACDIADYNPRSMRAFEKAGFTRYAAYPQAPGSKASVVYDFVCANAGITLPSS
jgi:RimJ/RimL family protein N-acetyltransferase